ncbi:uncharacterized protein LOC124654256 [Lolium rigidum]|uniref:uncharacterized protein LOC124654256 n=1 Tax=Lolium rigidum TaxID=89674 RepID=UPI001F5C7FFF|nr:uncharacterized protein LOC124654256 [Lolium rigidum]
MDPNQMMPRSFPMWPPPPPTSSDAMPPPPPPFLPPPNANLAANRGWKRKNPNPNPNSAAYQPPAIGDLQVQNRAKARRWFKPNANHANNRRPFFHKPKAKAPRNTSSFIIRAKRLGGIAPLVSPGPVTPAVLPTPVISPAHDERLLSDVLAQQQWGVDGYGSMKGLIRLRPATHAASSSDDGDSSGGSDVEEHVEVERRLDHDLSRFEMVYPQPGAVVQDDDEMYDRGQDDDVDVHVARLEEENLTLKERLFLVEREVGDMRRRLEAVEARFSHGALANAAAAALENGTELGDPNAAAAADDAVEQVPLQNGTERGYANAAAGGIEQALQNGTGRGAAGAVNDTVEEALKNDTEMGDATADADNTFEGSTEKGDASDNGVSKSLENGTAEPEKSGKEEESYSAGSEKNAEIGEAASPQGNGQEA